jgi:LAO/AO transport system kinase
MKTIVVSGERSGIGKTYLAEKLLSCLCNWSALKVTVSKACGCPNDSSCGICRSVKKPFYIVKDEGIINQSGKDTARLKKAGAKEVIWLKAKPQGLKKGLEKVFSEFSDCGGIVIEGNSVLKFLKPDLNIHVRSRGNYSLILAKEEKSEK